MQYYNAILTALCILAATATAAPLPQWDSGFDTMQTNINTGDSGSIAADGSTGDGDGQGSGYADSPSDDGGFSCIWSDPNGCNG